MKTVFLRVLEAEDKATALLDTIHKPEQTRGRQRFEVDPVSFASVPRSPFAYWVSRRLLAVFQEHPRFEGSGRTAKQGLASGNDSRFLRVWWEVPLRSPMMSAKGWVPLVKGGAANVFYSDPVSCVNWSRDGAALKAFASAYRASRGWGDQWSAMINATEFYFLPGLTWPLRASRFAPAAMPAGCAFSTRGCAGLASLDELPALLAILSSQAFDFIFKLLLGRFGHPEFTSGALQEMPIPALTASLRNRFNGLFSRAWLLKRSLDTRTETSHAFALPALLQLAGADLATSAAAWSERIRTVEAELNCIQAEIDDCCFELYGINEADRGFITEGFGGNATEVESSNDAKEAEEEAAVDVEEKEPPADVPDLAAELVSWAVGVAFGRYDVRLAIGERKLPPEPEPFDPLPVCSAGVLTDSKGIVCKRPPEEYPIAWPDDGVLVDDAGISDPAADRDIARLVRQVIQVVWRDKASDIEQELCGLLGTRELRDYLRKPTAFFEHYLKRYSKSRRKAPIYWPLSTQSGEYTVWVYYHRVTADTLYKIVAEHVAPKIVQVDDRIAQLGGEAKREGREGARATKELGELAEFLIELKDMREELLRVAKLPYKPDLNDGVQITAAPLWRLFRLPRWRSELEKTWKALEREEYDWAHLAYAIWPDRVKEKCKTDKSLAIAHGLEALYEEPARESGGEGTRRRGGVASGRGRRRR